MFYHGVRFNSLKRGKRVKGQLNKLEYISFGISLGDLNCLHILVATILERLSFLRRRTEKEKRNPSIV